MNFLKSPAAKVILVLLSFAAFSLACARRERAISNQPLATTSPTNQSPSPDASPTRININTASAEQLEKLTGVGRGFAQRIVEHREKYAPFRRPEHLIMVHDCHDKRFRPLRDLLTVDRSR